MGVSKRLLYGNMDQQTPSSSGKGCLGTSRNSSAASSFDNSGRESIRGPCVSYLKERLQQPQLRGAITVRDPS